MNSTDPVVLNSVRRWFEKAVLGLNLCPFASRPYREGSIHFALSHAIDDEACLGDLYTNLRKMEQDSAIETMIMICPHHLSCFEEYNQFLALAELLLEQQGWAGIFQIASFHPDYCFDGAQPEDRANWTNRSPFPLLHLIRESSISRIIDSNTNVEKIPQNNIEKLKALDFAAMREIFGHHFEQSAEKNRPQ